MSLLGKIQRQASESWFNDVLRRLPEHGGGRLRSRSLRVNCAQYSDGAFVGAGTRIYGAKHMTVCRGVRITRDCTIDARGGLIIADEAMIGFESVILTHTHNSDRLDVPIQDQGMYSAMVYIGARAWLGARVIVLPGVRIGEGAIVGSGSVVTKDVEPYDVVAGSPARVLRNRRDEAATPLAR